MNVFAQIGIIAIWFGLCGIPAWWHWKKFGYSWYGEPWLPPPKTSFDQEPELPRKWWLAGPRVEGPFYGVWAWYIFASMIFFYRGADYSGNVAGNVAQSKNPRPATSE
jgi:hypothetical protein